MDDFAIAATTQALINELCDCLKEKYTITETDNLESFLGIHIVQENGNLYLSQPGHIAKCTREANIHPHDKPTYLPMPANFADDHQSDAPPADAKKYSTLLGMNLRSPHKTRRSIRCQPTRHARLHLDNPRL